MFMKKRNNIFTIQKSNFFRCVDPTELGTYSSSLLCTSCTAPVVQVQVQVQVQAQAQAQAQAQVDN